MQKKSVIWHERGKRLTVLTYSTDGEGDVVEVEPVDEGPVGNVPQHHPADGVGYPDHGQQARGVPWVNARP